MRNEPITRTDYLSNTRQLTRLLVAAFLTVVTAGLITAAFAGSEVAFWALLLVLYLVAQLAVAIFVGRMIRGPE